MPRMKLLAACTGIALLFGACVQSPQVSNTNTAREVARPSQPPPAPTPSGPSLPPLSEGVVLKMTVEGGPDRKPRISGETNLPDGTELMFGVEGKTTNFSGGDKGVVSGGRFRSAAFGPDGGLKPGQYVADVTMPIPQVQPPQVREVIGANGENLRGPLVKKGGIGTTVEVERPFQLDEGGAVKGGTDAAQVAASAGEVREVLQAVRALERQGRDMESLRQGYPNDLGKVRRCGELMRERQPQARSLQGRAEGLPKPFSIHLGAAATELVLCVSCSRSALQNCDRARSYIDEAAKAQRSE
jgi:hypothetical protein